MKTGIYSLAKEPELDVYYRILDIALKQCSLALVVVRPDLPITKKGADVIQRLKPFIQKTLLASEWPGTQLIGEKANVTYFTYSIESVAVLEKCSTRLFQWVQPDFPEDLCLLKANGEPWLVSIGHEADGYFVLEDAELEGILASIPELTSVIRKDEPPASDPAAELTAGLQ